MGTLFALSFLEVLAVLILSFLSGFFCRIIFVKIFGGKGVFSPEEKARHKFNEQVVESGIKEFHTSPGTEAKELIEKYEFAVSDLILLFDRRRRCGLSEDEAVIAVGKPREL